MIKTFAFIFYLRYVFTYPFIMCSRTLALCVHLHLHYVFMYPSVMCSRTLVLCVHVPLKHGAWEQYTFSPESCGKKNVCCHSGHSGHPEIDRLVFPTISTQSLVIPSNAASRSMLYTEALWSTASGFYKMNTSNTVVQSCGVQSVYKANFTTMAVDLLLSFIHLSLLI